METRKRLYDAILEEHLAQHRQMAFVAGPRQVGKTTTCRSLSQYYYNWDNMDDRGRIVKGPAEIAESIGLNTLQKSAPIVLFDELHKLHRWKQFLKGFFDTYGGSVHTIVTGSSRLDIYRRGGDSLMGRYFLYRMHPFTIAEIVDQSLPNPKSIIRQPQPVSDEDFDALWTHGGYPEPFIKRDARFDRRWQGLRQQQLLQEDIRDLTQIHQVGQIELLVNLLLTRSSRQLVYSNLAAQVQVAADTAKRWIQTLCNLHLGFLVRPWFKNVPRSLRKEPKWFLRDWAGIDDPGDRAETFIGCHLLKAVEGWNDLGLGDFQLGYLRDTQQREVDFIVSQNGKPWFLVEVKQKQNKIGPPLQYYQQQLNVPHAFQVVIEAEYVQADCFSRPNHAIIVPARTFLSQLL